MNKILNLCVERDEGSGKFGYKGYADIWAIKPKYDVAREFYDGLALVKLDGKWGYIKPDGSYAFDARFDNASSFANGLAGVQINGKWGYIDTSGNLVIEARFDYAGPFLHDGVENEFAQVEYNGESGQIRRDGSWVI